MGKKRTASPSRRRNPPPSLPPEFQLSSSRATRRRKTSGPSDPPPSPPPESHEPNTTTSTEPGQSTEAYAPELTTETLLAEPTPAFEVPSMPTFSNDLPFGSEAQQATNSTSAPSASDPRYGALEEVIKAMQADIVSLKTEVCKLNSRILSLEQPHGSVHDLHHDQHEEVVDVTVDTREVTSPSVAVQHDVPETGDMELERGPICDPPSEVVVVEEIYNQIGAALPKEERPAALSKRKSILRRKQTRKDPIEHATPTQEEEPTIVKQVRWALTDSQRSIQTRKQTRELMEHATQAQEDVKTSNVKTSRFTCYNCNERKSGVKHLSKLRSYAYNRFATYAYWWVRQAMRKAIFQHSRTICLPDNVYGLLSKVKEAKRVCIQQGNHHPTKEDIALSAGMSVEKLDKLLSNARMPLSMQQSVWSDQDAIFQEVTADTAFEAPNISVEKQLMRMHTRNLLGVLNPKERKIIRRRFGIENGEPKSLSEIGDVFGLSKERVRQLESRALYKLKQCLDSQGLKAYEGLLL